jgi:hypothetical protein
MARVSRYRYPIPDKSHRMTKWEHTIVTIISTPRFGKFRKCKKCEAQQALTAAGYGSDDELQSKCPVSGRKG